MCVISEQTVWKYVNKEISINHFKKLLDGLESKIEIERRHAQDNNEGESIKEITREELVSANRSEKSVEREGMPKEMESSYN